MIDIRARAKRFMFHEVNFQIQKIGDFVSEKNVFQFFHIVFAAFGSSLQNFTQLGLTQLKVYHRFGPVMRNIKCSACALTVLYFI